MIPAAFYSAEGSKGLRRMVLETAQIEHLYAFENSYKIFPIHSSFKFIAFVLSNVAATDEHQFPAAFMLRRPDWLDASPSQQASRIVMLSPKFIREQSPSHLSFFEFRSEQEKALVQRIYDKFPPLGKQLDDAWNVSFTRELDMTNDSWLFRERDRLREFGGKQHTGEYWTLPDKAWFERQPDKFVWVSRTESQLRGKPKPQGKKAASEQTFDGFVLVSEEDERSSQIMVPCSKYVPLYEGRMVHQFDHAAKAYVTGAGRRAVWRELEDDEKEVIPHFFLCREWLSLAVDLRERGAYCRITGQTNERSLQAAMIPADCSPGDPVPTFLGSQDSHCYLVCSMNSLLHDWIVRPQIAMHIDFFHILSQPFSRPSLTDGIGEEIMEVGKRIPGQRAVDRACLRAQLDSLVFKLYDVGVLDVVRALASFPLLDRDQPWLPGDGFIAYDKKGKQKFKPRSFVTRDKVLLEYCRLLGETPPDDIVAFFAEAGVDINGGKVLSGEPPADPFNPPICATGPIRNLEERVRLAEDELGAVAYVPTVRQKPTEEALKRIVALEARSAQERAQFAGGRIVSA